MSLCLSGCGLFHKPSPAEQTWRKVGIDSLHFQSCGPDSLSQLHKHFGQDVSMQVVSVHIQENRHIDVFRILGLVNTRFRQITCPPELRAYLKRNGFRYERIKYEELQEGDFAIVLLKGYDDLQEWHWAVWPNDADKIPTFFENYTKIISTYRIYKN